MHTIGSIEIDRPIDEVFRLTNNHVAEWSPTVVEEKILHQTEGEVGTTFRVVTEENGRQMEFDGVVTRYEPPYASSVELTGSAFDIVADYRFEDLSGRTRVTQESSVNGKGFTKLIFLLCGWMMKCAGRKALQKEFESLKQFCEAH